MTANFCSRFHQAVELIGARWTGAIIRVLIAGPVRYSALRDAIPDISDRMLSERLRELEAEGVVTRLVLPDPPIGVEYALTEKGRALGPAMDAIAQWAHDWVSAEPNVPADMPTASSGSGRRSK